MLKVPGVTGRPPRAGPGPLGLVRAEAVPEGRRARRRRWAQPQRQCERYEDARGVEPQRDGLPSRRERPLPALGLRQRLETRRCTTDLPRLLACRGGEARDAPFLLGVDTLLQLLALRLDALYRVLEASELAHLRIWRRNPGERVNVVARDGLLTQAFHARVTEVLLHLNQDVSGAEAATGLDEALQERRHAAEGNANVRGQLLCRAANVQDLD